jgi:putative Mn2+ efflux pump MntP
MFLCAAAFCKGGKYMKGVIVQAGKPKSIVLFNNGKIGVIPTPANCHVGMVVTVKFNNLLKMIAIALAALLLIAAGIFIGARFFVSKEDAVIEKPRHERFEQWRRQGPGRGPGTPPGNEPPAI